mgnify:CR=1 FL=1
MHYDAFNKMFDTDTTTIGVYTQKGEYENIKSYIESLDKKDDYIQTNYIDELLKDNKLSITVTKGYRLCISHNYRIYEFDKLYDNKYYNYKKRTWNVTSYRINR